MIQILPSILSSDYSCLADEFRRMQTAGADMLHIDVMDGHFVPNITLGPPIMKCLRPCTDLPFDVHLMITHPLQYIPDFADAGANIITFHVEADSNIPATLAAIRQSGCKPALSVKPGTPVEALFPFLEGVDMVLIMTVEPGFGGQSFLQDMLPKIKALRRECSRRKLSLDIQVDGGITAETIVEAARAGANWFVAGSAIFHAQDAKAQIRHMRALAEAAYPIGIIT